MKNKHTLPPIDEARLARWDAGVSNREEEFVWKGNHPLWELYEELLDSLNYIDELAKRNEPVTQAFKIMVRAAATQTRAMLLDRQPPPPSS